MPKVKRDQGLLVFLPSHLDLREVWTCTPFSPGLFLRTAEASQQDCPPLNLEMDIAQDYTYFISKTVFSCLFTNFFLSCSFKSISLELRSKKKHFFLSFPTWQMTAALILRRLAQPFFLIPSLSSQLLFFSLIFQPWQEELKISCCFLASTFLNMSSLPMYTGVALPSPWMVPHICSLKLQRWEWFSSTWNTV